jgi:Holliday junction resolvasome RuvABC endonuclease subunit
MTTTVLGVDPSSVKFAIVESSKADKKKPTLHVCQFEYEAIEMKVLEAFDFGFEVSMNIRERDGKPPEVFVEAPIQGVGGPGATIPQAFCSGAFMAGAVQAGCKVHLINNQTWKKRALGNGNINKQEVRRRMGTVWPELVNEIPIMEKGEFKGFPDQDLIDAGGLNRHGWWYVEMLERLKKRRKAA